MPRIHILGASGSGATTLGGLLAAQLGCPHEDSDDYLWLKTDPPYTTLRPMAERLALLIPRLEGLAHWVFSGSSLNWAASLEPLYDLVVFLHLDPALRLARLRAREVARHGSRIQPGGDMADGSRDFLEWAASYDTAGPEQRSRTGHELWLAQRTCPVLRLDSSAPVDVLLQSVQRQLRF